MINKMSQIKHGLYKIYLTILIIYINKYLCSCSGNHRKLYRIISLLSVFISFGPAKPLIKILRLSCRHPARMMRPARLADDAVVVFRRQQDELAFAAPSQFDRAAMRRLGNGAGAAVEVGEAEFQHGGVPLSLAHLKKHT